MDRCIISGAVVVMDPRQGDILAMASRPNFHPGRVGEYLQSEGALLNRAVLAYQPGSVFKTVIAAAALEEGLAGMYSEFTCTGGVEVEGLFIPCSQLHPRSRLTLLEAFAYSCNSVFIRLALELGPEKVYRYARKFGLGEMTGLPVGETAGYLPAENEMSWPRNLANIAIGQGDLLVTPLQAAVMMAAIANGGTRVQPRLALSLVDERGRIKRRFPIRREELFLSDATVNRLKYMLRAVVVEGTGKRAALTAALSGAKTGTAQSGRRRDGGQEILNHWIAGFYPVENARAVIVVFADQLKEGTVSQVFGEIALYLENS